MNEKTVNVYSLKDYTGVECKGIATPVTVGKGGTIKIKKRVPFFDDPSGFVYSKEMGPGDWIFDARTPGSYAVEYYPAPGYRKGEPIQIQPVTNMKPVPIEIKFHKDPLSESGPAFNEEPKPPKQCECNCQLAAEDVTGLRSFLREYGYLPKL